jgi:spore germination cell wall hydrolase CwlJ-like protein
MPHASPLMLRRNEKIFMKFPFRAAAIAAVFLSCAGSAMAFDSVTAFSIAVRIAEPVAVEPPPLDLLVAQQEAVETQSAEQDCLASAVYFEARGEPLQGQLAVAEVVLNRAASGRYPASLCEVVRQRAQFSFVRRGHIPDADRASQAWRRAVAVARIAGAGLAPRLLPTNCLWYHANYVSPSWGRRLARSARIGLHIFYS